MQPIRTTPQQKVAAKKQKDSARQKQKLKQYIRQHALKYVKPPPDPQDATYPQWYQGLRKVENIIYAKYMNKQRKRMEMAQQRKNEDTNGTTATAQQQTTEVEKQGQVPHGSPAQHAVNVNHGGSPQ